MIMVYPNYLNHAWISTAKSVHVTRKILLAKISFVKTWAVVLLHLNNPKVWVTTGKMKMGMLYIISRQKFNKHSHNDGFQISNTRTKITVTIQWWGRNVNQDENILTKSYVESRPIFFLPLILNPFVVIFAVNAQSGTELLQKDQVSLFLLLSSKSLRVLMIMVIMSKMRMFTINLRRQHNWSKNDVQPCFLRLTTDSKWI